MKTAFDRDILIPTDRRSSVPLRVQLERQLRVAIQSGRLQANSRMPSTRALGDNLGVARGVVVEAYEQLIADGYLSATVGAGTYVTESRPGAVQAAESRPDEERPRFDFEAGTPDVAAFPRGRWLACLKRAYETANSNALGYPAPQGLLVARSALASFLSRSRATVGNSDRVLMCNGFTQGILLIARALKARGLTNVAIEDPSFGGLYRHFQNIGLDVQCVPIDEHGLVVDRLGSNVSAVVVTPGHQFPTGAAMNAERRTALLAWAVRNDSLIIEDDYDSEFRYDRQPLGSLQGMAPDRVIYVGTASKMLAPALRLGWLLAPNNWIEDLTRQKMSADAGSPTNDQLALAEFLDSGEMDTHLRKMRPIYRQRRDVLVGAIAEFMPGLRVHGIAAGLHLMVDLPAGTDERDFVARSSRRSVRLVGAGKYRAEQANHSPAIVLGYGCVSEASIRLGVSQIADLLAHNVL